jgi:transcriptional regulator with XRE-family HTH domain
MDAKYEQADLRAAELLRTTRRERGLTQTDVAALMARHGFTWSQPTVARVERGHRALSLAEAHALMDILEQNEGADYRRINQIES